MKVRVRLLLPNGRPGFERNKCPQKEIDGVLLVGI